MQRALQDLKKTAFNLDARVGDSKNIAVILCWKPKATVKLDQLLMAQASKV